MVLLYKEHLRHQISTANIKLNKEPNIFKGTVHAWCSTARLWSSQSS